MKIILICLCMCFGLLALVFLIVHLYRLRRQTLVRNKIIVDNGKCTMNRSSSYQSSYDNVFEVSRVRVFNRGDDIEYYCSSLMCELYERFYKLILPDV